MPSPKVALIALYVAIILMSVNGVLAKTIPLHAVTITQLRCVMAAIALALFAWPQKSRLRLNNRRHYPYVFFLGALMALHWSSFFYSMQVSTVAIGILAHYSYPIFTVLCEPLLNGGKPKLSDLVAGTVVLAGVALMVPDWHFGSQSLIGASFGLLSALAFGTRNILQRRWLRGESSSSVMLYQIGAVAILTAPFADWTAVRDMSLNGWQMIIVLGLVTTAMCHTLIAVSLRTLTAKSVSLISCLQPPIAIFLSWMLLAEVPDLATMIGGTMILATAIYESLKVKT